MLERLPAEALADLTEQLIARLDASEPDPDLKEETDCCCAEDAPVWLGGDHSPGDPDDAEPGGAKFHFYSYVGGLESRTRAVPVTGA